jgi:hypothetical protein
MNDTPWTGEWANSLDNFAAELTGAVYPVALHRGLVGSWVEVELGLWRVLAESLERWVPERPRSAPGDTFAAWRAGLLMDLTEGAVGVTVKHGIKGSRREVESDLSRALCRVVRSLW